MNSSDWRLVEAFVTLFDPFVTVQVKSAAICCLFPLTLLCPLTGA